MRLFDFDLFFVSYLIVESKINQIYLVLSLIVNVNQEIFGICRNILYSISKYPFAEVVPLL